MFNVMYQINDGEITRLAEVEDNDELALTFYHPDEYEGYNSITLKDESGNVCKIYTQKQNDETNDEVGHN